MSCQVPSLLLLMHAAINHSTFNVRYDISLLRCDVFVIICYLPLTVLPKSKKTKDETLIRSLNILIYLLHLMISLATCLLLSQLVASANS